MATLFFPLNFSGSRLMPAALAAGLILAGAGCGGQRPSMSSATLPKPGQSSGMRGPEFINREVRHELVMLPYYGVFDNLSYRVDGSTVTLFGQVTRPTLKSDAEQVVKRLEGIDRVVNEIEVLPLGGFDDQTRLAVFRAIYGSPGLDRYGLQAVPSIHIIVKNGNVTLEGVVANEGDKNMAGIRAQGVANVFAVENRLRLDAK